LAGSALLLVDFATLQTRKSPSSVCVANMSVFCREDEECHANVTIGDGALEVVKVCRMVNEGCNAAINSEPFKYLHYVSLGEIFKHRQRNIRRTR
jgi:hypothetical protein